VRPFGWILALALALAAGAGAGAGFVARAQTFAPTPIIRQVIAYAPPGACPEVVPSTPLTPEELAGLARARDTNTDHAARVEALLRGEIADLKALLDTRPVP
jgi:hypothetical protein